MPVAENTFGNLVLVVSNFQVEGIHNYIKNDKIRCVICNYVSPLFGRQLPAISLQLYPCIVYYE